MTPLTETASVTGAAAAQGGGAPRAAGSAGGAAVTIEIFEVGGSLAGEVKAASGASPMSCFQCGKCSAGCPVAARGDLKPHELVRLVQTGQRASALGNRFIWECTSCHTCITRCPQQVDIPAMNDALREMSLREGVVARGTAVPVFNRLFLQSVRKRGRVHELSLMACFKLKTRRFLGDMDKAPAMFSKGKLSLFGGKVKGKSERDDLFRRAVRAAAEAGAGAGIAPAREGRAE